MSYKLIKHNLLLIEGKNICFPKNSLIKSITELKKAICFYTFPKSDDLNWNKIETHKIWKDRCENNPSELFCYKTNGVLKWKLPEKNITGFGKIDLCKLTESDFITPEHYRKYIEKYKGKELLEVYADSFRFVVDANTGEIYDKMESR
jgi:hypothetical protein